MKSCARPSGVAVPGKAGLCHVSSELSGCAAFSAVCTRQCYTRAVFVKPEELCQALLRRGITPGSTTWLQGSARKNLRPPPGAAEAADGNSKEPSGVPVWARLLWKHPEFTNSLEYPQQLSLTGLSEKHLPCEEKPHGRWQCSSYRAVSRAIPHGSRAGTARAPSEVGSLPRSCGALTAPSTPDLGSPCADSQPHSHPNTCPLPLQTPPNWVVTGLRVSRFYTSYLSATVPPVVQRGRGHQRTSAELPSRCPAANPNHVLLLVKGISESLSSIRFHRADALRAEAGISFSPFPEALCCAPRALRNAAGPGSPAGGSGEGRRREAGRGPSEGRRNNFRSLHSLFLSGNASC